MSSGQFPTNIEKDPSYFVATEADKYYLKSFSFPSGTYIINWPSSASVYFEIFDGDGSSLGSYGPSSGGLAYIGLNSKGEKIILKSDKAHTSIGIKRIPSSFMSDGMTLDTITSTQTYTQTGVGYAVLVGGGGGGSGSSNSGPSGGSGGGSGRVVKTGLITLTGNMSIVVGANGGGGSGQQSGGAGGNTTFAGYTAQGGAAGLTNGGGNGGAGGGGGYQNFSVFVYYFTAFYRSGFSGGTGFTGSNGAAGIPNTVSYDHSGSGGAGGETTVNLGLPVKAGTTGGGCGGSYQGVTPSGKGSGIGTGGSGGNNSNGGSASGYGGGGGGAGGNTTYTGGAGSPGVVYILRGNLI